MDVRYTDYAAPSFVRPPKPAPPPKLRKPHAKAASPPPPPLPIRPDPPPSLLPKRRRIGDFDPDAIARSRQNSAEHYAKSSAALRDIAPMRVEDIDWDRRLACAHDLTLFEETYLTSVFDLEFSAIHHFANERISQCVRDYGRFAIAMPRGNGKTALCRGGIVWSIVYGYKKYVVLISSNESNSITSYGIVKTLLTSPLLVQDFPEICYPIARLGNNVYKVRGQIYKGQPTFLRWSDTGEAQLPSLLLDEDAAATYDLHCPGFLKKVSWVIDPATGEKADRYITANSGTVFEAYSIDGAIRGVNQINPITQEIYRPDLALLDDVQRDAKIDSPTAQDRLMSQIGGTITNLSSPDKALSILKACTIMREDDVSSTYTDPEKTPEYSGVRFPLVSSWPPGITDYEVMLETPAGKAWTQYEELRRESYRQYKDIRLATEFYEANRQIMDDNFEVTWPARFDPRIAISPQQFAMELRINNPLTFPLEMQNRPRRSLASINMISADQFRKRQTIFPKGICPPDASILVSHIDVGNEVLWYVTLAVNHNFDGTIVDYGTWPEMPTRVFSSAQCDSWSLITSSFFQRYPQLVDKCSYTDSGKPRAPLDAKMYYALSQAVPYLLGKSYYRDDVSKSPIRISRIGIDTRWGDVTDVLKRFIRESKVPQLMAYQGQYFPPTRKQLEEYKHAPGWVFENQKHPSLKEAKWVLRQAPDGGWYLQADVSRLKDFLFQRLGSPTGSAGSICIYQAPEQHHDLISKHVCDSEYPEPVSTPGLTKNEYQCRVGFDNDYLDALTACMALASFEGACFRTTEDIPIRKRRNFREMYDAKQKSRLESALTPTFAPTTSAGRAV